MDLVCMVEDDINQGFRFKYTEECFVEWWQVDEGRADGKKEVNICFSEGIKILQSHEIKFWFLDHDVHIFQILISYFAWKLIKFLEMEKSRIWNQNSAKTSKFGQK